MANTDCKGASRQTVVILDFGSQVTQLIARRVREAGLYSEIVTCHTDAAELRKHQPAAIILSGGPASVGGRDAPGLDADIFNIGIPVLGICYGMQLIANVLGGSLEQSSTREYGPAQLTITASSPLWHDIDLSAPTQVWMSHGDKVQSVPPGFSVLARTDTLAIAAMGDEKRRIYGLQFHPEVHHSIEGQRILENFLYRIASLSPDWNMASFATQTIKALREKIGSDEVICALSGGIDSTVVAVLLHRAIGSRLHCIFVDNGLLRLDEAQWVVETLRTRLGIDPVHVDAADLFLQKLANVDDPEQKRKIIGHTFIEIFEREAKKFPAARYLAQGTLYPDVIESVSAKGPSAVIKSHHNVGGLPEHMKFELVEPLRDLFKDEVRKVAL